jgi:hypothetical protein
VERSTKRRHGVRRPRSGQRRDEGPLQNANDPIGPRLHFQRTFVSSRAGRSGRPSHASVSCLRVFVACLLRSCLRSTVASCCLFAPRSLLSLPRFDEPLAHEKRQTDEDVPRIDNGDASVIALDQ